MKINLEEIQKHLNQRKRWNSVPLGEIEFYEKGEKIEIPKEVVEKFELTGLNNIDFISSGYYKREVL